MTDCEHVSCKVNLIFKMETSDEGKKQTESVQTLA